MSKRKPNDEYEGRPYGKSTTPPSKAGIEVRCPLCDKLLAISTSRGSFEIRNRGQRIGVIVEGLLSCPKCGRQGDKEVLSREYEVIIK